MQGNDIYINHTTTYLKIVLNFALLLFGGLFFVQAQVIHGVVTDSLTKEPVPFANVTLIKKDRGVSCDFDGKFEFDLNGEKSN